MQEFEKQSEIMDMKEEMVNNAQFIGQELKKITNTDKDFYNILCIIFFLDE